MRFIIPADGSRNIILCLFINNAVSHSFANFAVDVSDDA